METIHQVDVSLISEEDQVRTRNGFDKTGIDDLAASLRSVGMLQPVLLRKLQIAGTEAGFVVVAGHRRVAAARVAGIEFVPARLVPEGDEGTDRINLVQLTENIHRQDLALMDVCDSLRKLASAQVEGDRPLHVYVGKSKAWVSKRLAVTSPRFPEELRGLVEAGQCEDVETLNALAQLRGLPDSAVTFARMLDAAKAGKLTREQARDALKKFKEKSIAKLGGGGEEEGEEGDAAETQPDGKITVSFTLKPEEFEILTRIGGPAWIRRQLKREAKKQEIEGGDE